MPKQNNPQPLLDISKMDIETGITIPSIKLKYLSKKQNEYGTNHMFQLLDERQFKQINSLGASNLKMPVWEYEEKYYLKINDKKVLQYSVDQFNENNENGIEQITFTKDVPYIMDLTFYRYEFEKNKETIKGYTISKINNIY